MISRLTLAVVMLASAAAQAQYTELAATDDGRQLYFSSTLTLDGSPPAGYAERRIYRLADGRIELFAERGALAPVGSRSSGDGMAGAQVSGDGDIVAFTAYGVVAESISPWFDRVVNRAEVRGAVNAVLGEGSVQLSRNGRWALVVPDAAPGTARDAVLIDVFSGSRATVPAPDPLVRAVTSDGSVLTRYRDPEGRTLIGVWREGKTTAVKLEGLVRPLAISDNARFVVYSQIAPDTARRFVLRVRDRATERDHVIFESQPPGDGLPQSPVLMGMSNDGQWILYRVMEGRPEGAAYVASAFTGEVNALPLPGGELVSDGTISGYGNAAFLAATSGSLLRYNLLGGKPGAVETLIPATPFIPDAARLSPGSLVRLRSTLRASPDELKGRLLLDGRPLPVLFTSGETIAVQVPWEQRAGDAVLRIDLPSASPFRQNELVTVWPQAPSMELSQDGSSLTPFRFVKADFSGLLDGAPQPGEIFHTYFTGLGAVKGNPATGEPVPAGSIMPIDGTLACGFLPAQQQLETLFAGLAPGMIGIYQVSFRMPGGPAADIRGMQCTLSTASGQSSFTVGILGGTTGQPVVL